jgi:FkbM family methyltransferase
MTPINRLKTLISQALLRRGYKVERIYNVGEHRLNVFEALIEQINPEHPEFFVLQVGANDGATDDPVRASIQRYHWSGVLLEPLPDAFSRLTATYRDHPQVALENAALASFDGTAELWAPLKSNGVLASFDRAALMSRVPRHSSIVPIAVRTVSMATLLRTHRVERLDLLQVDTEGFDFEVIRMLFLKSSLRPRLIRYEHLHLSNADRAACVQMLAREGYRLLPDGIDTIALRRT